MPESQPGTASLKLWHGVLKLGDDWAVWQGHVGDSYAHSHFAAQAVLGASSGRVLDAQGKPVQNQTVLIEPMVRHQVLPAKDACLIFLEPRKVISAQLPELLDRALRTAISTPHTHLYSHLHPHLHLPSDFSQSFWQRWQDRHAVIAIGPGVRQVDEETMIDKAWQDKLHRAIDAGLPDGRIELANIARQFHLSAERFRHVFTARVGMPFKRFVLWRRLHLAVRELQSGSSVTLAALNAGFADTAHFGRTLKHNFGISARQILF